MNYEITTLDNGIRVVAAPLKERKAAAVGIWVQVGGRDEEPRVNGISHFLEHLVFKGTHKRTAHEIKESVEGIGGSLNAFTSEEHTCFLAKAASRHFEKVFDVLSDMILGASLKEEDVGKERTVIMEEIKMTQDQPSQFVDELLSESLWPAHALGRPLAGTLESVGRLTRQDIRDYRDRYYTPRLITVTASGDIDQKRLVKATRRRFERSVGNSLAKDVRLFRADQNRPRLVVCEKKTEQTHLELGLHAFPKGHPDECTLELLSIVLGGNMSSRLFNEVREERGLAYDISAHVRKYHETGAFVVSAGMDDKKLFQALEVILKELEKTVRQPVRPDEIRRAKEFYLGQLDLGLESSMNHMLWVGENVVTLGRCKTMREVHREVERVTAADLRRVAGEIFKTRALNLAVIGPVKGIRDRLEKSLTF